MQLSIRRKCSLICFCNIYVWSTEYVQWTRSRSCECDTHNRYKLVSYFLHKLKAVTYCYLQQPDVASLTCVHYRWVRHYRLVFDLIRSYYHIMICSIYVILQYHGLRMLRYTVLEFVRFKQGDSVCKRAFLSLFLCW